MYYIKMETVIASYNIFIDSKYRKSGTPTDFSVELVNSISLTNPMNYFRVKVISFECPYSFNSINSTNNTLSMRIQRGATDNTGNITITAGNYNINTLLNELRTRIIARYTSVVGLAPTFTLSFTYSRDTGKATLNINGTDGVATTITLSWSNNLLLSVFFGFTANTVLSYNGLNVTTSSNFTSNNNVNCNPVTAIFLRSSNLIQSHNYENIVEPVVSLSDILRKIQVLTPPNSYIIYSGDNAIEIDITNKLIEKMDFYLTDNSSYNVIDLNGLSFSFRINIEEIKPSQEQINAEANATSYTVKPEDVELENKVNELQEMKDELLNELENIKQKVYS